MNDTSLADRLKVVGQRPIRPDGADKVTGRAAFGADLRLPGMLVGRIKRSPHAHARILAVDTSAALRLPGVKSVVTAADFPEMADVAVEGGEGAATLRALSSNCMARDKVLYVGHAVAAVAAKALLERNPDPSEEEIRFGLAGNLCRCTGYDKIVRAVQDAAAQMRQATQPAGGVR